MSEMEYKKEREIEDLKTGFQNGIKYVIKSLGTHPTCYIGIEEKHPLAGYDYDDIPIEVHGGLTYSSKGDGDYLEDGYWWYGWDYAHAGDYAGYYDEISMSGKKWTTKELESEVWHATHQFSILKNLIERIIGESE